MKIYRFPRFLSKNNLDSPYLIAGLGNPGKKYIDTRHNVGFDMLDVIASANGIKVSKIKFKALFGVGKIKGKDVILAKPQTYMNLSGESIREIAHYYKIPPEQIIIIYDDVAIDLGRIRIRKKGSAGGHNGMKNIIYHLKTEDFPRIRIGVGGPGSQEDISDYVLGRFSKKEIAVLTNTAKDMPAVIDAIIEYGMDSAMNKYN
ncbi:MAG: aminoacyl-tRNA hydrolase [Eubacteriales bacterium]|nr:aminoacyl-tRNA hydrolase [Eubacteriales bacterium]